ncbi:MAG: helix-turn-helix domain-containing protein [Candidatus Dadabacteria bacterium]|nr:helix-turn-helix domain-containing protein [Candidatus Dadabacteria bacterium]
MEQDVKPGQLAYLLQVDISTIQRWVRRGQLRAIRLPSGRIRIPAQEVERIRRTEITDNDLELVENV